MIKTLMWDLVYFIVGLMCMSVVLSPSLFFIWYDDLHGVDAVISFLTYIIVLLSYMLGRYYIVPRFTKYVREVL